MTLEVGLVMEYISLEFRDSFVLFRNSKHNSLTLILLLFVQWLFWTINNQHGKKLSFGLSSDILWMGLCYEWSKSTKTPPAPPSAPGQVCGEGK